MDDNSELYADVPVMVSAIVEPKFEKLFTLQMAADSQMSINNFETIQKLPLIN